jgi:hypothetical protein
MQQVRCTVAGGLLHYAASVPQAAGELLHYAASAAHGCGKVASLCSKCGARIFEKKYWISVRETVNAGLYVYSLTGKKE